MVVRAFIVTDEEASLPVEREGFVQHEILGKRGEEVGVEIKELLKDVTESVAAVLTTPSELTIEVSGSVSLKGKGSLKYFLVNVGAEADKQQGFKVVLKTQVVPP